MSTYDSIITREVTQSDRRTERACIIVIRYITVDINRATIVRTSILIIVLGT